MTALMEERMSGPIMKTTQESIFFLVVGSIQKVSSALKWTNTRTHRKSKVFVSRNKNEERKKALLRKDFSLRTAQNSQLPLTRKFI